MKRLRADETVKEGSGPPSNLYRTSLPNAAPAIAYTTGTVKVVSEGMQSSLYSTAAPVSFGAMPAAAAPHSGKPQAMQPLTMSGHTQARTKGGSPPSAPPQGPQQQQSPGNSFQRLKVEDALSYLDMVKFKFSDKPQVYNDFLDIMKEFKSQSIDTPGVIQRVSHLFKGYPELIVGFNTFLPPGYKIEVQRNDQGYAFQVSVSVPTTTGTAMPDTQQQKQSMILSGSGTIIHSNMSSNIGPPASMTPSQQQQSHTISSHVPSAPPPPAINPVLHQATGGGGGGYNAASNIHNNTSSHNALTLTAAHAAVTQALQGGHVETPQNQPVEFNHAITYVNKIKNRFQGQPEKYKRFLEILHTYQKEQRTLKEACQGPGGGKHLTEQEVYSQVAKLFENQNDLLAEFGQFLPDATSHINPPGAMAEHLSNTVKKQIPSKPYRDHIPDRHLSHKPSHLSVQVKRSSPPYSNQIRDAPPPKKHKMTSYRDVTIAEAGKYGSLNDFAFFDKVRKAVRSQDVYNNFLRCLTLFNQEIVSKSELIQLASPFLSKFPELMRWFREFLGQHDVESIPFNATRNERPQGDHAHEIDYSTAKRLGASYCVIPPAQEGLRFSGRTQLCHEVLNNQWVSFPTWSSEESAFVGSRKNQYEEHMYRCEDERFELDVVIETNASTIRVLEGVAKKLSRMNADEVAKYRLDDCLGGSSPVLHQRALRRIYGDKAQDIIDGLQRNPAVAVPVVLRRLKAKEEEWREAQKGFNKIWREQNEKHYLKSLDYQGINFKQNDIKALRSKSLFNEIETIFEERNEQNEEGSQSEPIVGPHLVFVYRDPNILDDAANLLIHHMKRQTGVQKGEKRRIKHILRQFVPDLFFHPRQQLSDDERDDEDDKEDGNASPNSNSSKEEVKKKGGVSPGKSPARGGDFSGDTSDEKTSEMMDIKEEDVKVPLHAQTNDPDEAYTLYMASNNWYLFLRLHAILCDRLTRIYQRAIKIVEEERKMRPNRKDSTAVALRLKPKPQIEVEDYYPAFLDMVKNLLDGNMEPNAYEDTLREMFGIHAYIAFTLDKVVSYAVRQLQHCVSERTAIACLEMFQKEQKRGGCGGLCATAHRRLHQELAYQHLIEKTVQDENCFKIYIYKRDSRMTIEMIDTDTEELKKLEDNKKWSTYKENYADCSNIETKPTSPLFLGRNMRKYNKKNKRNSVCNNDKSSPNEEDNKRTGSGESSDKRLNSLEEELERKLNQRAAPERDQTEHRDYDVSDDTQCRFNTADSKIMYVANKDSFLYKRSALTRAKQTHPVVTKYKASRFRDWCKKWAVVNVSDTQSKQCTDWLMGRGDNVVPNRTRVLTNNDLTQTPYVPYNRYRVDLLKEDSS